MTVPNFHIGLSNRLFCRSFTSSSSSLSFEYSWNALSAFELSLSPSRILIKLTRTFDVVLTCRKKERRLSFGLSIPAGVFDSNHSQISLIIKFE